MKMAEQICDPPCSECDYLNENGVFGDVEHGQCGGCFNEEDDRCMVATSPKTIEERGPFTLGELDILGEARLTDKLKYLKNWSIAACRFHEAEKRKLLDRIEELEKLKNV